jgi:phosphoglycolate phosphatase-like HAD superfamily hydrolase
MRYKALFFDFDGVIADSVEVKTRAFAELFKEFGPEIQAQVVKHHRSNGGMTRKDKFIYYYKEFLHNPLDTGGLDTLCRRFSALVVDEVVASDEIPGAKEVLERWSPSVPCFVVSATPDDEIVAIAARRGVSGYFKEILGSGRTKTENLAYLLKRYALSPETSLFFGDAASDYRAAMDCGVNFLGILPGPEAPLLKIAPDIKWARNFTELDFL